MLLRKIAHKPKPPFVGAALASWVELLNSQAGGGRNYEDVESIFGGIGVSDNTGKVLELLDALTVLASSACRVSVRLITEISPLSRPASIHSKHVHAVVQNLCRFVMQQPPISASVPKILS